MMIVGLVAAVALGCAPNQGVDTKMTTSTPAPVAQDKSCYDFTMKDIDGKEVNLGKFKGKVLLVVNVASFCGNTPQYAGLEKLYTENKDKGFEILGFPANEFGQQEPGDSAAIKEFCTSTYHVNFPMFEKIVVKGEGIHPLYQWLLANSDQHQDIEWNFAKFLISRDGKILKRYNPKVKPESEDITNALATALEQK